MKIISEYYDGQIINKTEVIKAKIPLDQVVEVKNGYKINFVGIITNKDNILVSFPKKYIKNEGSSIEIEIKILIKLMIKFKSSRAYCKNNNLIVESVPYDSISFIAHYYNKYGLYMTKKNIESINSNGRILWNKSLNKNMIISNLNIIVYPLIRRSNSYFENIITYAMMHVVHDISSNYEFLFKVKPIEFKGLKNSDNENFALNIIDRLIQEKKYIFKDNDKQLIEHLIKYFKNLTNTDNNFKLYTNNFEYIWQDSVKKYLNDKFIEYNGVSFLFGKGIHTFNNETFFVGNHPGQKYRVDFDHIAKYENKIYIFDSKYYDIVDKLDYKQVSYHYFAIKKYGVYSENIINSLILPTNQIDYYSKCHINRKEIDGLYIHELYLPINAVVKNYIK